MRVARYRPEIYGRAEAPELEVAQEPPAYLQGALEGEGRRAIEG